TCGAYNWSDTPSIFRPVCWLPARHPLLFFFFFMFGRPPTSTLFPYTTLFRSDRSRARRCVEACVYGTLDFVGYPRFPAKSSVPRSEERFSRNAETDLVCRLLLEKKNPHDRRPLRPVSPGESPGFPARSLGTAR